MEQSCSDGLYAMAGKVILPTAHPSTPRRECRPTSRSAGEGGAGGEGAGVVGRTPMMDDVMGWETRLSDRGEMVDQAARTPRARIRFRKADRWKIRGRCAYTKLF